MRKWRLREVNLLPKATQQSGSRVCVFLLFVLSFCDTNFLEGPTRNWFQWLPPGRGTGQLGGREVRRFDYIPSEWLYYQFQNTIYIKICFYENFLKNVNQDKKVKFKKVKCGCLNGLLQEPGKCPSRGWWQPTDCRDGEGHPWRVPWVPLGLASLDFLLLTGTEGVFWVWAWDDTGIIWLIHEGALVSLTEISGLLHRHI